MKLGIITVVKNDINGLNETLSSVNQLDRSSIRLYVWINSDSFNLDGHLSVAKEFADDVMVGNDDGVFDAMNKALNYIDSDYVLFLNARDTIVAPFNVDEVDSAKLIRTIYTDYFNTKRDVRISKSVKFGMPYCHQGMILPRIGLSFDKSLKYGADYQALLDLKLKWPLDFLSSGVINYDNTGISTINRWEADKWTYFVVCKNFGHLFACFYIMKCLVKLFIKRLYDFPKSLKRFLIFSK